MINRVVADPELPGAAMEIALRLAEGPASLRLIRKMYWASLENSFEQQLDLEAKYQMQAGLTDDYSEGVAAFREKRRTRFIGR
jgi:2-(1,2-epoxy-1,2-dihydrophenyl)acetyl-CoA isomerase